MITFLGPVTSHQESWRGRCGVSQQDGINKKSGIGCVCQFHRGSISMEIGAVICGFARFAVLQLLKKTLCSVRFALRPMCPAFDNEVRVTAKRGGGRTMMPRVSEPTNASTLVCIPSGLNGEIYDSSFARIDPIACKLRWPRDAASLPSPVSLAPSRFIHHVWGNGLRS